VDLILESDHVRVGAPTVVETAIVLSARRAKASSKEVPGLLKELDVTVVAFGDREWEAAVVAYQRYGRGRHKAGLNLGDGLAYATATVADDPLLFVGQDFIHTDITPARR
jgi:ribonuclease VapC